MPSHLNDPWNWAVTFLVMQHGDNELTCGSGFFWRRGDRTFLVSNWHNLSGRDPETSKPRRPDGGLPDRVKFTVFQKVSTPDAKGFLEMKAVNLTKTICGPTWLDPVWLEHPVFRRQVDVAAVDITGDLQHHGLEVASVNLLETDAALEPHAGQDVFILGYPLGLVAAAPIPVWKRGSIATDPAFDPDGQPKVFVDSATRDGMSGSIVVARRVWWGPYKKSSDGTEVPMFLQQIDRILGIYSGRIGPHDVAAQLGIVWKRHLIDEVVAGGATATV
jgi:hypothetical protein